MFECYCYRWRAVSDSGKLHVAVAKTAKTLRDLFCSLCILRGLAVDLALIYSKCRNISYFSITVKYYENSIT